MMYGTLALWNLIGPYQILYDFGSCAFPIECLKGGDKPNGE